MIGRWGTAAALLLLAIVAVADLGLAAAILDHAQRDVPGAVAALKNLPGPDARLALAGRQAIQQAAIAAAVASGAGLLLGCGAARLSGPAGALFLALLRIPALTALVTAILAWAALVTTFGPITASLAAFRLVCGPFGLVATLAVVLAPVVARTTERAARRLDRTAFESLATLGIGPLRRLISVAFPAVLPAAIKAGLVGFVVLAAGLFGRAWPVAARQDLAATAAASLDARALAALGLCAAVVLALAAAIILRGPAESPAS
jgi:ABC-type sulfate transport system permease component